jgi:DNA-directed RNA polymerase subunit RPC12/RpoP
VAPDCVNAGYTVYTCSECGDSYQSDTVSAAGHSYHSVVTPATCTKEGYTTYTCAICGDSYQDNFTPIVAHDYHCTITAPTCTTGGHTTYKCIVCGDTYDGNYTDPTGHSYENGSCVSCGEPDPNAVKVPTLTLKYPSLNLEDMVSICVYFSATDVDDVVEMGLVTYSVETEEVGVHNAEEVIPGYSYDQEDGLYAVATNGIAAKNMGETIWFAVYAKTSDGNYIYTKLVNYSPMAFAYNQLKQGTEANKKLSVALLNYGAAAQIYFNYKTDSLMNSQLTDEHLALLDSYRSDMMTPSVVADAAKAANFVRNGGHTSCFPVIVLEGAFAISYNYIPKYSPVGDITMYVWDQDTFASVDVLTKENATAAICMNPGAVYTAEVGGIAAKDLDQAVYVSFVYNDGITEYCSGVLNYSIGDYCTSKVNAADATAEMAAAIAVYCYYAKQMFCGN